MRSDLHNVKEGSKTRTELAKNVDAVEVQHVIIKRKENLLDLTFHFWNLKKIYSGQSNNKCIYL